MSFYNPNIQAAFDADNREFIVLKNMTLASYDLVYSISEGCSISTIYDIRNAYQIQFVRFVNNDQQENLRLVNHDFFNLFGEISLEVFLGRIKTFDDYLLMQIDLYPNFISTEILYKADNIQDFIELLVFSDIAVNKKSSGVRDFTKLNSVTIKDSAIPVYYQIYDRLKLYTKLRKEIRIEIIPESIILKSRELNFTLTLKIN